MNEFTFDPRPIYIDDDDAAFPGGPFEFFGDDGLVDTEGDPNSIEIFKFLDNLNKGMRGLVHEFGAVIVASMWSEGYSSAKELRPWLETWRTRRQEAALNQDYNFSRKNWLQAINHSGRRRRSPRDVAIAAAEAIARSEAMKGAADA